MGSKSATRIPLVTMLNGLELAMYVHTVEGNEPGPTLGLLSTSHGSEFLSVEQIRAVIQSLDPSQLRGTVLAIPVANPAAFQELRTTTPQDEINMNRVFPGKAPTDLMSSYAGGLTELMAYHVYEQLVTRVDVLLDFHLGPWGQAVEVTDVPLQTEGEARQRCLEIASMFDVTLHEWVLPPGSAVGQAVALGKPAIGVEIGGGGFGDAQANEWIRRAQSGVLNVMRTMGMLPGELELPGEDLWICTDRAGLRPTHGGYHVPALGVERFGATVEQGEILGRTFNSQTFELLEEIRSPYRGILYLGRCSGPVHAGDWGYVVGDLSKARKLTRN